jgi:hypothetical protein
MKIAKRVGVAALGVLTLISWSAEPAIAHERMGDPPPGQFGMEVRGVNGSGCPAGTTSVVGSDDKTAFTVTYSNYTAQNGGGVAASLRRAQCVISVRVSVPNGYTFGITTTTFRGFADLAEGATGTLNTRYWFVGMPMTGVIRRDISGEFQDNWQATDDVPLPEIQWMPCHRGIVPLNIDSSLVVNAGRQHSDTTSVMTMDATDSEVTTVYNISWRAC